MFAWTTPTPSQVLDCFLKKRYLYVCICVGGWVRAKVKKKRREWSYLLLHSTPFPSPSSASQYLGEILDGSDWPIQIYLKRPLKEKCRNWLEIELCLHVCHLCALIIAAQGQGSVSMPIVDFQRRKSNSLPSVSCPNSEYFCSTTITQRQRWWFCLSLTVKQDNITAQMYLKVFLKDQKKKKASEK